LLGMKNRSLPKSGFSAAAIAVVIGLATQPCARAQQGEAPATSKGENFSAKPPAQLFASDCTGSGCHKGPQGLAKNYGIGLAGFLREHYTNSRESAAALAAYLTKIPGPSDSKEARKPKGGKLPPPTQATGPGWFQWLSREPAASAKPAPKDERAARQHPNSRASHTAVRPEEAVPGSSQSRDLEPAGETAKPSARDRAQRNRPATAAAAEAAPAAETAAPAAAATPQPSPPPTAAAAPTEAAPAPAAATPPKRQYDIFD
jgi:hypothetical protein